MNEATKPETGYPDIDGAEFFKGDPLKKAEEVLMEGKNYIFYNFFFTHTHFITAIGCVLKLKL